MLKIDLLLLLLANYGVAWTITQADITEEFREFLYTLDNKFKNIITLKITQLFNCIICAGAWTSSILLWMATKMQLIQLDVNIFDYILVCFLAISTNLVMDKFIDEG